MHQEATTLQDLPGSAVDIDVGVDGAWVAMCKRDAELVVATSTGQFPAPDNLRFPQIRWMGNGDILVVDTRTTRGSQNAFVLTPSGIEKVRFCVGDGVADVLVVGESVVVTYFDEGIFGGVAPSEEGLAVFASDGRFEFGYQSGVKDPVDIADCYCVCPAGPDEVCFSPYTEFPLVRLNLKTRQQQVHKLPRHLAGSSALATDGIAFYIYAPYDARNSIFRWRPGEAAVEIGNHVGPLRGHRRAAFLSAGTAGYAIVNAGPA